MIIVLLEKIFEWNGFFFWRACTNQQLPSNCFAAPHQLRESWCFTPKKQITSIVLQGVPIVSHESPVTLEPTTGIYTKQDPLINWATSISIQNLLFFFLDKWCRMEFPMKVLIYIHFFPPISSGYWCYLHRNLEIISASAKPTHPTVQTSSKWTPIHPPRNQEQK